MIQVKVCGMRDPQNIEALLALPIDYIGFIFYPKSKRYVGDTDLSTWIQGNEEAFGLIKKVGVFVNENIHELFNYTHDYQLDYVQLHGTESPEYCREIASLWRASTVRSAQLIKAFSVDENFDFETTEAFEEHCSFFIFDTKGADFGGTGQQFNWDLLTDYKGSTPFLLSGGIHAQSVEAIQAIDHPMLMGVDINSRFETEPALKDIELIKGFVQEAKMF